MAKKNENTAVTTVTNETMFHHFALLLKLHLLIHRRVQRGGGGQGVLTPPFSWTPPFSSVTPPLQPNPISQTNVM